MFHPILDERADEAQRNALFYILSGEDQPVGTMFQIFSVIIETIKDPLFAKIDFDWDLEKRQAKVEVDGILAARSEPIRNPVTDEEHRMLTVLPNGWVFHEAETPPASPRGGSRSSSISTAVIVRWRRSPGTRMAWFTAMTSTSRNTADPDRRKSGGSDQRRGRAVTAPVRP